MTPIRHRLSLVAAAFCLLAGFALARYERPAGRPEGAPGEGSGGLIVSSSFGATSAILFVVDPVSRSLAAYEALPGEKGGVRLLGARKIEHDLELAKYKDQSEYSYFDLRDRKAAVERGGAPGSKSETKEADKEEAR